MTSTAEPAPPVFAGSRDRLVRRLGEPAVLVCGVVNVTPDSFNDGGRYRDPVRAVDHGHTLVAEGAEMLDVGGESTRPGSHPPSVAEEIARVVPVIDALARSISVPISVDTSRPEVMREAVAAGAVMVNDVRALRLRGALDAAAALKVPVCLMHMQGEPATMQIAPTYYDVVARYTGSWSAESKGASRPVSHASTSCSTRASGSARRWSTISRYWQGCDPLRTSAIR